MARLRFLLLPAVLCLLAGWMLPVPAPAAAVTKKDRPAGEWVHAELAPVGPLSRLAFPKEKRTSPSSYSHSGGTVTGTIKVLSVTFPKRVRTEDDVERQGYRCTQADAEQRLGRLEAELRKRIKAFGVSLARTSRLPEEGPLAGYVLRFTGRHAHRGEVRLELKKEGKAVDPKLAKGEAVYVVTVLIHEEVDLLAGEEYNAGSKALNKKDCDAAVRHFTAALRLAPNYWEAYYERARAYTEKKEYDKAVADCTAALRINPRDALCYAARGNAHEGRKDYEQAIKDYAESIRLDPRLHYALNNYAWILATCPKDSLRDGKKAVAMAKKVCELTGWKYLNGLDTLAAAYAEGGDFKEAVRWQRRALEVGAADADYLGPARQRLKLYEAGKPYRE
jgi:tetratricopeptide (TPR) repeat protein